MSCLRTKAATEAGHPEWADLPSTSKEARALKAAGWPGGMLKQFFTGKPCKHGHVSTRSASGGCCFACQAEMVAAYRKTERGRAWMSDWAKTDTARAIQKRRRTKPDEKAYMAAWTRHREAVRLKATPPWITVEDHLAMRALYDEAARLTQETGILHHVDHIVPLQSMAPGTKKRNACGLHIPANLQVIPATDNIRKNCYFNGGWS